MIDRNLLEKFDAELLEQTGSRRDMLGGMGKAGALVAAAGIPAIFASILAPSRLKAQEGTPTVTEILEFALTLEYLEYEFYRMGLAATGLIPAEDRNIFQVVRDHEFAHVRFLENALGVAPDSRKPEFDFTAGGAFPDVFTNYATFRALAQGFEDTGVRAYKGQAPNLMGAPAVLTAALTIHSVEGRHASMIRRRNGNFEEEAPQKGWISGRQTGVVPAQVGGQPVGDAIYGPGMPAASFPAEDNVTQGGVNLTTLTYTPPLEGQLKITEAFDEPLDMDTVVAIASLFIVPPPS
jgi:hypothetical protein